MSRTANWAGERTPLAGKALAAGSRAPSATLRESFVSEVELASTTGRVRVISVTPSLDTNTCATQTKRFYDEAQKLPDVDFIGVSCDLPPAMARFCETARIDPARFRFLSDYHRRAFGQAFGTYMPEVGLDCRAAFVLGKDDTVLYAEYVDNPGNEPDYDAILRVLQTVS